MKWFSHFTQRNIISERIYIWRKRFIEKVAHFNTFVNAEYYYSNMKLKEFWVHAKVTTG